MKTLREYIDQLDEISRRDLLKGAGAAAVAGAAGGAKADRSWSKDELSQQFVGTMTSETFSGALLTWKDENKNFFLNLREPENFSAYNLEKNRLYFPKITSPTFQIKFGDDQPISGSGEIYTFPLRQFGNYTGFGMTLARGKTFDRWRDSFINADKVVMRLEIDGQPTTMVFHDNPGLVQQRNQQKTEIEKQRVEQEKQQKAKLRQQVIDEVLAPGGLIRDGLAILVSLDQSTSEYKELLELARYFAKIEPEIIKSLNIIWDNSRDSDSVLGVPKNKWISIALSIIKKLKDAKEKIEELSVNESAEQVEEASPDALAQIDKLTRK